MAGVLKKDPVGVWVEGYFTTTAETGWIPGTPARPESGYWVTVTEFVPVYKEVTGNFEHPLDLSDISGGTAWGVSEEDFDEDDLTIIGYRQITYQRWVVIPAVAAVPGRYQEVVTNTWVPPHVEYSSSGAWDATAISVTPLSGDGYFEFQVPHATGKAIIGLIENEDHVDWFNVDYGFLVGEGFYQVIENGVTQGSTVSYDEGDIFKITRTGTTITYQVDGSTVDTSGTATDADNPIYLHAFFYLPGDSITEFALSDGSADTSGIATSSGTHTFPGFSVYSGDGLTVGTAAFPAFDIESFTYTEPVAGDLSIGVAAFPRMQTVSHGAPGTITTSGSHSFDLFDTFSGTTGMEVIGEAEFSPFQVFSYETWPNTAYLNSSLPALTIDATGSTDLSHLDAILPSLTIEAYGGGNLDANLPALTISATASAPSWGVLDLVLSTPTLDATAIAGAYGTLARSFPALTIEAAGGGNLNVTLPAVTLSAAGTTAALGILASYLPALEISADGVGGAAGALDALLPALSTQYGELVGELPSLVLSAQGEVEVVAAGQAWVINTKTNAHSRYTLGFTNLVRFKGEHYLLTESGDILLLNGENDSGAYIDAHIQTASSDFDDPKEKRLEGAYLGGRESGGLVMHTITGEDNERQYQIPHRNKQSLDTRRVKFAKGVKARYWAVAVKNVDGGVMDVNTLELLLLQQGRKR